MLPLRPLTTRQCRPRKHQTYGLSSRYLYVGRRISTKINIHESSPDAPRQVPTPLAFVRSSLLEEPADRTSAKILSTLAKAFANKGYSSLEVDLALPSKDSENGTTGAILNNAAKELNNIIRTSSIPFPPVLISYSLSSLLAQAYVSSYPATALVLISPPPTVAVALSKLGARPEVAVQLVLPTSMKEFDFEPRFPVAIFLEGQSGERHMMESCCRLVREGADLIEVEVTSDHQDGKSVHGNLNTSDLERMIQCWMDEVGV